MDSKLVIFCDIDGIVADCNHRLHYLEEKDYDSFYSEEEMLKDAPIKAGVELIRSLQNGKNEFCFLTGRPVRTFETTYKWFRKYHIAIAPILMRKNHDYRKAGVVKVQEIQKYLEHNPVKCPIIFIDDDPENLKAVSEIFPEIKCILFGIERLF